MSLRDELLRRFPALRSLPANTIAVGGAVRDLILARAPADVDIECDDPLSCATAIGKVIPLGRGELKVYRVVVGDLIYDFSAKTTLGRRDFTMNAMSVDLTSGEMSDPYDGRVDIDRKRIRMIHQKNFQDDPLRMLRGVRLALQFDFSIESQTVQAIRRRAGHIGSVAAERVKDELQAIFSDSRFRHALRLLNETALDEPLFGYSIDAERFLADDVSRASAYALLLRNPSEFAERWKWSDALLREVLTLQSLLRAPDLLALYDAGPAVAAQLPGFFAAAGRGMPPLPDFSVRSLLDGQEIARVTGIVPGPELGRIKRALLESQLRGEVRSRAEAEALAQRLLRDR